MLRIPTYLAYIYMAVIYLEQYIKHFVQNETLLILYKTNKRRKKKYMVQFYIALAQIGFNN